VHVDYEQVSVAIDEADLLDLTMYTRIERAAE
jgi:hypothetical protein